MGAAVAGVVLAAVALAVLFRRVWTRPGRARRLAIRAGVFAIALAAVLLAVEGWFRAFVAMPDSFGFTKTSEAWFRRHWKPINALGYRDVERDPARLEGRRVLVVLGDSFAAGHGIEDPADRIGDRLGAALGDTWATVLVARPGWDTLDEHRALVADPVRPDAVLLVYYVNDVEGAAARLGAGRPPVVERPAAWLRPLLDRSHLADFAYWRLYRFRNRHLTESYWEYLEACFDAEPVWRAHERELLDLADYARGRSIELAVVVFPYLVDVEASRPATARVRRALEARGVRVVDLTGALAGRDPRELVVNSMDAHPARSVHREAAERVLESGFPGR